MSAFLLPQHEALIRASAISPDVASDRGYRSVLDPGELRTVGFADFQCRTPGLLIPIWDVAGQNGRYQFRPDDPRLDVRRRPVKYETPHNARPVLDVPRSIRHQLDDPAILLHITEGSRKVDAAISHGLCCIGLSGVWGWRGTNERGGKTALADWETIAISGREIRIAFDSDVLTKPSVRLAIDRFAAFLRQRGARVRYVVFPEGPNGAKTGFDDCLAQGHTARDLDALVVDTLPDWDESPVYPVDAFPPIVARYIIEAAAALDAPPEMVGAPLLGFAGAAIGNTRFIEIKRGFRQRSILWVAVVAQPGSAKTPAIDSARTPLTRLQREANGAYDMKMATFKREDADWNALDRSQRALIAKPIPPRLEHFFTTDATKESLGVLSAESPGVAVYRDELAAFVAGFNAYRSGRGGDRQDMLSFWSGTALKIDRKGAPSIVSDHPTVCVIGGVQPDKLQDLAAEAGQDGFLDRFLWVSPDVPAMRWTDAEISGEAQHAIDALFARLRVPLNPDHPDGFAVRPTDAARQMFVAWYEENRALQDDAPPLLRGVYAKLPQQLLRIAHILHCMAHPDPRDDQVSIETMEGAIALVEFHRAQAGRVMRHFHDAANTTSPTAGLQPRILRILRMYESQSPGNWVSYSVIYNGLRNIPAETLQSTLAELVAGKSIERRVRHTDTKSAEEYRFVLSENSDISEDGPTPDDGVEEMVL